MTEKKDSTSEVKAPDKNSYVEKEKEIRRKKIWNSRTAFIKSGHLSMQSRRFGEAAVSYEKYIRILEVYFNVQSGGLTPEVFKESAKTSELSILSSIYWDLVRVYDNNVAYVARQAHAAEQLAKFAVLTPVHKDIVAQAEAFLTRAKQPQNVKIFLNGGSRKNSRCFIATAAFNSSYTSEVIYLKYFRDSILKNYSAGRLFIHFYYRCSPPIAEYLDAHPGLKKPTRWALRVVIKCVSSF